MLEPVILAPRLGCMQSHKWLSINIGVHALNIGIGMMVDVVLNFPVVCVAAQHI